MNLSELIEHLTMLKNEYGDVKCFSRYLCRYKGDYVPTEVDARELAYTKGGPEMPEGVYI